MLSRQQNRSISYHDDMPWWIFLGVKPAMSRRTQCGAVLLSRQHVILFCDHDTDVEPPAKVVPPYRKKVVCRTGIGHLQTSLRILTRSNHLVETRDATWKALPTQKVPHPSTPTCETPGMDSDKESTQNEPSFNQPCCRSLGEEFTINAARLHRRLKRKDNKVAGSSLTAADN